MTTLLLPAGLVNNRRIIEYANIKGYETIVLETISGAAFKNPLLRDIKPTRVVTLPTRYERQLDREEYDTFVETTLYDTAAQYNVDAIIQTSGTDPIMTQIAKVNQYLGLPGITPDANRYINNKIEFGSIMWYMGAFDYTPYVAETYRIYDNNNRLTVDSGVMKYPCICKPVNGTGGYGVYVVNSEEELNWFFSAETELWRFSKMSRFNQDRLSDGKLKNHRCASMGGSYMVQEFKTGELVSVAGYIVDGKFYVDLCYDIGVVPLPNRSESEFSWPMKHDPVEFEKFLRPILTAMENVFEDELTNSPFMMDVIYDVGVGATVVDFSLRMSSSASHLGYFLSENSDNRYQLQHNAIEAQVFGEVSPPVNMNIPTYHKIFPFPAGDVMDITIPELPEGIREAYCPLISGDKVNDKRNDNMMLSRGSATAVGRTVWDAQNNWDKFYNSMAVDIKPFE